MKKTFCAFLASIILLTIGTSPAAASPTAVKPPIGSPYTVLHAFQNKDGANSTAGLVAYQGAFYGTTQGGGSEGYGTVFKLTPPTPSKPAWTETVLYSFTGSSEGYDSRHPLAGLIVGSDGVLYGTANAGGLYGYGTVFKVRPPRSAGAPWTETVLYNFCSQKFCHDGSYPEAGVIFGKDGALYGTTTEGGSNRYGAVFRLAPPPQGQYAWTETVLYSLCSVSYYCYDGYRPKGSLIADQQGALYSTTEYGGSQNYGTVFKLTPPKSGTVWTQSVLYSFYGASQFGNSLDGDYPVAGLIAGGDGALYGTTSDGGAYCYPYGQGCGTVFKVTPPASAGATWTERVLYNFCSVGASLCNDGAVPTSSLTAYQGALYGTTQYGGRSNCKLNPHGFAYCGTIFKVTPGAYPGAPWAETVLHYFQLGSAGMFPHGSLIVDRGAIYGTTTYSSMWCPYYCGSGTAYKLTLIP